MKSLFIVLSFIILMFTNSIFANPLDAAISNSDRTSDYVKRDQYRHPKETLTFFGIKPSMSVIELWPSRGWYSEILEPFLSDEGIFFAADLILTMRLGRLKQ